jgi:hypothetical protein
MGKYVEEQNIAKVGIGTMLGYFLSVNFEPRKIKISICNIFSFLKQETAESAKNPNPLIQMGLNLGLQMDLVN